MSFTQLVPNQKLGRYELIRPLAKGGMAEIWLGQLPGRHGFRKRVAIKVILPELAARPMFRRMFLDEALVAARIEHPDVAQVFDLGEANGRLFIVMEWIEGISAAKLERALRRRGEQLPLALALRITSELSAALHAAHELRDDKGNLLGVVHRDVSPENVLLTKNGCTKLIDFGIVKTHHGGLSDEISAGGFKGKLRFAAPEQTLGLRIDRRADVWAVGAVLYYLLAQRVPYEHDGKNAAGILAAYSERAPLPDSVPASVARIIERALALAPEHRFDSCLELQGALEQAIVSEGQSATRQELAAYVTRFEFDAAPTLPPAPVLPRAAKRVALASAPASNDDEPTRDWAARPSLAAEKSAPRHVRRAPFSSGVRRIALSALGIIALGLVVGIGLGSRRAEPEQTAAPANAPQLVAAALDATVTAEAAVVQKASSVTRTSSDVPCPPSDELDAVPVDRLPLESTPAPEPRRGLAWRPPHRKQVARSFTIGKSRTPDVGF
jgi:serine/threonine-protein kinase